MSNTYRPQQQQQKITGDLALIWTNTNHISISYMSEPTITERPNSTAGK